MSDTTKTVLWIVLALVIIAAIIWFFMAGARRRAHEAQQGEADLRSQVQDRLSDVQGGDGPSAPATVAAQPRPGGVAGVGSDALQHQEIAAPSAGSVAPGAAGPATTGERLVERGAFGRPAPAPVAVSGVGGAGVLVGADAFTSEDEEPDLADAENPFASTQPASAEPDETAAQAVPSRGPAPSAEPAGEADWVNLPVDEPSDEELAAEQAEDREAVDWINGPGEEESRAGDFHTLEHPPAPAAAVGEASSADEADWVNGPVEEPSDEELAAEQAEDREAVDWINGPGETTAGEAAPGETTAGEAQPSGGDFHTLEQAPAVESVTGERSGEAAGPVGGESGEGGGSGEGARGEDARGGTDEASPEVAEADWVNGPVDEPSEEELAAEQAEDKAAVDWINGPGEAGEADEPSAAGSAEPDTVSVPALDDLDDVIVGGGTPADDPGDHRGQPWSTSPGPAGTPAADVQAPDHSGAFEPADEDAGAPPPPEGQEGSDDPEGGENPGPVEHSDQAPLLDDVAGTDEGGTAPDEADAGPEGTAASVGAEAPEPAPASGAAGQAAATESLIRPRRVSAFEEVRDGGFGIGSAAAIEDGAQPLGHAVKASRGDRTYVAPGAHGYDELEPDVWFFNEEAARRAGFRAAGE